MSAPFGSAGPSNVSYNRDASTVNQTPSTPLLLGSGPPLDIPPDVPPPSYEEATGISPTAPGLGGPPAPYAPPLPQRTGSTAHLAIPGTYPVNGGRRASAGSSPSVGSSSSQQALPAAAFQSAGAVGAFAGAKSQNERPVTASGGRVAAPGSVPRSRQFPAAFNLYGDNFSRSYTLGEHQHMPLYAVRFRPSWQSANPVMALHNGPNPATAPPLATVELMATMSENLLITLPPPLTYRGTGSTAVRLSLVMGWSHFYTFTMEVGTDAGNVRHEEYQWRHSSGTAIAALGGARDGWKLIRMATAPPPGTPRNERQPPPAFTSSDGREVVAMYADARMSMTKQLKFAFVGTGRTGALGERWAVMAVTSALAIWDKEEASQTRH